MGPGQVQPPMWPRRPLMARTEEEEEEERETDQYQRGHKPPPPAAGQCSAARFGTPRGADHQCLHAGAGGRNASWSRRCSSLWRRRGKRDIDAAQLQEEFEGPVSAGHGGAECGHSCSLHFWRDVLVPRPGAAGREEIRRRQQGHVCPSGMHSLTH